MASYLTNPASLARLDSYIGGFKDKKLVYIPTAANGERGYGCWKTGGSWQVVPTLGARLDLLVLEDHIGEDVIGRLKDADMIWLAGGQPGYLMYWLRRFKIDKALLEILNNGTVLVGSSAGSMVMAKDLKVCDCYIDEEEAGASVIPGLGLVDFDFYPHFRDEQLDEIKAQYKGEKMYLVKDGEDIVVENNKVTVFGEERIIS